MCSPKKDFKNRGIDIFGLKKRSGNSNSKFYDDIKIVEGEYKSYFVYSVEKSEDTFFIFFFRHVVYRLRLRTSLFAVRLIPSPLSQQIRRRDASICFISSLKLSVLFFFFFHTPLTWWGAATITATPSIHESKVILKRERNVKQCGRCNFSRARTCTFGDPEKIIEFFF